MGHSCRIKWNWSDRIDPLIFQKFCNYLINYYLGKRVSPYDREGLDCGIDGMIEYETGEKGVIQAKRYKSFSSLKRKVIEDIQNIVAHIEGRQSHSCPNPWLNTKHYFLMTSVNLTQRNHQDIERILQKNLGKYDIHIQVWGRSEIEMNGQKYMNLLGQFPTIVRCDPLLLLEPIEKTLDYNYNKDTKYPGERWPKKPKWCDFRNHVCPPYYTENVISKISGGRLKKLLIIGESATGKSIAALLIGKVLKELKEMPVFYLNIGHLSTKIKKGLINLSGIYEEISYCEEKELIILDDLHCDASLSLSIIGLVSKGNCKSSFIMTSRDTITNYDDYEKIEFFLKNNGKIIHADKTDVKRVVQWLIEKKSVPTKESKKVSNKFTETFHNLALICCALARWQYGMKIEFEIASDRALEYLEEMTGTDFSARDLILCICALWQYEKGTPESFIRLLDFSEETVDKLLNMGEISQDDSSREYKIQYHPQTANLFLDVAEERKLSKVLKTKITKNLGWRNNISADLSSLALIFLIERDLIPFEDLHDYTIYQGKTQMERFADMIKLYLKFRQEIGNLDDEKAIWILSEFGDVFRRKSSDYFDECKLRLNEAIDTVESLGDKKNYEKYIGRILYNLAYIEYLQNNFIKAEELFSKAEEFEKKCNNELSELICRSQKVLAYWRHNRIEQNDYSLKILEENLDNFRRLPGRRAERWVANSLAHISKMYIEKGFYGEAETKLKEARKIYENVGYLGLPQIQFTHGVICVRRGNIDEGITILEDSLNKFEMEGKGSVYLQLGIAYEEKGNINESNRLYKKALEECDPQMDNMEYIKIIEGKLKKK